MLAARDKARPRYGEGERRLYGDADRFPRSKRAKLAKLFRGMRNFFARLRPGIQGTAGDVDLLRDFRDTRRRLGDVRRRLRELCLRLRLSRRRRRFPAVNGSSICLKTLDPLH